MGFQCECTNLAIAISFTYILYVLFVNITFLSNTIVKKTSIHFREVLNVSIDMPFIRIEQFKQNLVCI